MTAVKRFTSLDNNFLPVWSLSKMFSRITWDYKRKLQTKLLTSSLQNIKNVHFYQFKSMKKYFPVLDFYKNSNYYLLSDVTGRWRKF